MPAVLTMPQPSQALTGRLAAAQAALRLQNEMAEQLLTAGADLHPRGAALLAQIRERAAELRGQVTLLRAMEGRA